MPVYLLLPYSLFSEFNPTRDNGNEQILQIQWKGQPLMFMPVASLPSPIWVKYLCSWRETLLREMSPSQCVEKKVPFLKVSNGKIDQIIKIVNIHKYCLISVEVKEREDKFWVMKRIHNSFDRVVCFKTLYYFQTEWLTHLFNFVSNLQSKSQLVDLLQELSTLFVKHLAWYSTHWVFRRKQLNEKTGTS